MRVPLVIFEQLVRQAVEALPEAFLEYLGEVAVDVEAEPGTADLRALGLEDPRELMGQYLGTPLTQRSVEETGRLPDRIVIYQRNVERVCRTKAQIVEQVRLTVLHEIGHHFGLDEDELDAVGYG